MRYSIKAKRPNLILSVEDSFTLLDFMAFFACFFLGFFFAVFLWIFAVALLIKLFTRKEYEFDEDGYQMRMYLRIFGYVRIKLRILSFDEIDRFLFSNYNSGNALIARGLIRKEWLTLEIILKDKLAIELVKRPPDELEEIDKMYLELKELMGDWFRFQVDYEAIELD